MDTCGETWPPDWPGDHEHVCARLHLDHSRHMCLCGAEMWEDHAS